MREKFRQYRKDYPTPPQWNNSSCIEFWRQYIDGNQQNDANSIISVVQKKFNINLLDYLQLSMPDFINLNIDNKALLEFIKKSCGSRLALDKTVYENLQRVNGLFSFEKNEKNYLAAMVKGRVLVKDHDRKPMSKEFIFKLHEECINDVKFPIPIEELPISSGSRKCRGSFPLRLNYNASEQGIEEWINTVKERSVMAAEGIISTYAGKYEFIKDEEIYILDYDPKEDGFRCFCDRTAGLFGSEPPVTHSFAEIKEMLVNFLTTGIRLNNYEEDLNLFFHEVDTYYARLNEFDIGSLSSEDILYKKVFETVRLIKSCLVIHPFEDANCRVLVMQLLPKLLSDLGLGDIYFFKDPVVFAMYSTEQCVGEVLDALINAQQITRGMQQQCSLFENSSTRGMLAFLEAQELEYYIDCLIKHPFGSIQDSTLFSSHVELSAVIKNIRDNWEKDKSLYLSNQKCNLL